MKITIVIRCAMASGLIGTMPAMARATTTATSATMPIDISRTLRCCAGVPDGTAPMGPRVRGARNLKTISPITMPTPAAPKPQCQPTRSPSAPVMIGASSAPLLMPM